MAPHVQRAMAAAQAKPAPAKPTREKPVQAKPAPAAAAAGAIQRAALSFDTSIHASWTKDKANCQLCSETIGRFSRHHCRVCGRSVCGVCSSARFQVRHRIGKGGRSQEPGSSSDRVCVECILYEKIARASGVAEFLNLQAAANAAAGIPVLHEWRRFSGKGLYSVGKRMIYLDPSLEDAFSTYLFELTNAAQSRRMPRVADYGQAEQYAFSVEFTEFHGTLAHQRAARAINQAGLGFRVTEMFAANAANFEAFNRHYAAQQTGHTDRYREQWKDYDKARKDAAPPPPKRRNSYS